MDPAKISEAVSKTKDAAKLLTVFKVLAILLVVTCLLFLALDSFLVYEKPSSSAGALVVLAGKPDTRLVPAVRLFKAHVAPLILLTNDGVLGHWSPELKRNLYQVEWAEKTLIENGVPESAIVKLPFSKSGTYFDAKHALEYAADNHIGSLLIVTSDFHTRRAYMVFSHLAKGSDIVLGSYPADTKKLIGEGVAQTCKRVLQLSVELVKLVYYQLSYGI